MQHRHPREDAAQQNLENLGLRRERSRNQVQRAAVAVNQEATVEPGTDQPSVPVLAQFHPVALAPGIPDVIGDEGRADRGSDPQGRFIVLLRDRRKEARHRKVGPDPQAAVAVVASHEILTPSQSKGSVESYRRRRRITHPNGRSTGYNQAARRGSAKNARSAGESSSQAICRPQKRTDGRIR